MTQSSWETYFALQITEAGLPAPVREYKFHPSRRFRFDFCYPDLLLGIEIDGATYSGGRHTTGAGYSKDCEKFALAAIEGYRVIRITTQQVSKGLGIEWLKEYFKRNVENK